LDDRRALHEALARTPWSGVFDDAEAKTTAAIEDQLRSDVEERRRETAARFQVRESRPLRFRHAEIWMDAPNGWSRGADEVREAVDSRGDSQAEIAESDRESITVTRRKRADSPTLETLEREVFAERGRPGFILVRVERESLDGAPAFFAEYGES